MFLFRSTSPSWNASLFHWGNLPQTGGQIVGPEERPNRATLMATLSGGAGLELGSRMLRMPGERTHNCHRLLLIWQLWHHAGCSWTFTIGIGQYLLFLFASCHSPLRTIQKCHSLSDSNCRRYCQGYFGVLRTQRRTPQHQNTAVHMTWTAPAVYLHVLFPCFKWTGWVLEDCLHQIMNDNDSFAALQASCLLGLECQVLWLARWNLVCMDGLNTSSKYDETNAESACIGQAMIDFRARMVRQRFLASAASRMGSTCWMPPE